MNNLLILPLLISVSVVVQAQEGGMSWTESPGGGSGSSTCPKVDLNPEPCNATSQITCSKGYDSTGCQLGTFCHDLNMNDPCSEKLCPCNEENEITCRSSVIDPVSGCPPYHTCIPKDIETSFGKMCPNHCRATCPDEFKSCPGNPNNEGCLGADSCVQESSNCPSADFFPDGCPIKKGKRCKRYCPPTFGEDGCKLEQFCSEDGECPTSNYDPNGCKIVEPMECLSEEKQCSLGYNDKQCLLGYSCIPKRNGNCTTHCPVKCDDSSEMSCTQGVGYDGCPLPDICATSKTTRYIRRGGRDNNELESVDCPNFCRENCNAKSEKTCQGVFNENGCQGPQSCVLKEDKCPISTYDYRGCVEPQNIKCNKNEEKTCPSGYDVNGCQLETICVPHKIGKCRQFCDVNCSPDDSVCPGGIDNDGCPRPDNCVPKKIPSPNNLPSCDGVCPQNCARDEVKCITTEEQSFKIGHYLQTKHCVIEEYCITALNPSTNCTNYCSQTCLESQIICTGPKDKQGCKLPDICVPMKTISGGIGRTGNDGECDEYCPVHCSEDEIVCFGIINEEGCRGEPSCVPKDETCPEEVNDDRGCKLFEPKECADDESYCAGTLDSKGCSGTSTCIPLEESCPVSDFDQNGCPIHPAVTCNWGEQKLCPAGEDQDGCQKPGLCMSIKDGDCYNSCPILCDEDTEQVCAGGVDSQGCNFRDFCAPIMKPCPRRNPASTKTTEKVIHIPCPPQPSIQPYHHPPHQHTYPGHYPFYNYGHPIQ